MNVRAMHGRHGQENVTASPECDHRQVRHEQERGCKQSHRRQQAQRVRCKHPCRQATLLPAKAHVHQGKQPGNRLYANLALAAQGHACLTTALKEAG